jgi:hypothetical protein
MKKLFDPTEGKKLSVVLIMCVLMFTGCAANNMISRFDVNQAAVMGATTGIGMVLIANPQIDKAKICTGFVLLDNLLNAPCCWNDYITQINNTFSYDPTAKLIANDVIGMLNSDSPILGSVNMSDTDKENLKKDFSAITAGIGCK